MIRNIILTSIIQFLFVGLSWAGGGFEDAPQQQMSMPQGKIQINIPPTPTGDKDYTGHIIAASATVIAAGLGYLGVRQSRKQKD